MLRTIPWRSDVSYLIQKAAQVRLIVSESEPRLAPKLAAAVPF
jgi:hypothetical protein